MAPDEHGRTNGHSSHDERMNGDGAGTTAGLPQPWTVQSDRVRYSDEAIVADYT